MSWNKKVKQWIENTHNILSINHRNLGYVYKHNKRRHFSLADNKAITKAMLSEVNVPVPDTFFTLDSFHHVSQLDKKIHALNDFVLKPAQGRGGNGIKVVTGKNSDGWISASGNVLTLDDIKRHAADVIFGNHSLDKSDIAIFEKRLIPVDILQQLSPWGLPDVRIIVFMNTPIMAMCRIPTKSSGGRANLHQGAVAMGIDIKNGISTHAIFNNKPAFNHPDNNESLIGVELPFWQEVIDISKKCADTFPLKYLGIDIAIDQSGPKVLEVNVRPGLAIQLANDQGLYNHLLLAGN